MDRRTADQLQQMARILIARSRMHCALTRQLVAAGTAAIEQSRRLLAQAEPWMDIVHRRHVKRQD